MRSGGRQAGAHTHVDVQPRVGDTGLESGAVASFTWQRHLWVFSWQRKKKESVTHAVAGWGVSKFTA